MKSQPMNTFIRMEPGRNWRASVESRLVRQPIGRAALHLAAFCRTRRNFAWHRAGIARELREALRLPPHR